MWYGPKTNVDAAASISKVNDEASFEKREEVYEENRVELIAKFR
jgi:hypothetical protein